MHRTRHVSGRKPLALISALLVMLLSLVPFMAPPCVAPGMARAAAAVVTIRDAATESLRRGSACSLVRAAGVAAGLVRLAPIQPRAINAFGISGNRMFARGGPIRLADGVAGPGPAPQKLHAWDLRNAAQRDNVATAQREPDDVQRRRSPR